MASEEPKNNLENTQENDQDVPQQEEYLNEEDVLEVEEIEIDGQEPMDEDNEGPMEEQAEGMEDNTEDLLANGLEDSRATFVGHGVDVGVFSVALHPIDSLIAVSGGEDDKGRIWRTDSGSEIAELNGHTDSVSNVAFNFDGEMVATGGMDGRVRVWRRTKGAPDYLTWEFLVNLEGPDEVNWIDWHPKGNVLLAGSADGTVWMWNLPSGQTLHVLSGHMAPVTCGRFTPDGKKIVTCSEDSTLILWDPKTGQPIHKLQASDARFRLEGGINCVAVNPQGTVAVCGGADGGLRAVNLVQGTVLAQMIGHEEGTSIEAIAFSAIPDGGAGVTVCVSVGTDSRVCTWEAVTFKLRSTALHEDAVTSIAFAHGTNTFITGSADKTIKVWDYRKGSCERTLLGHREAIHAVTVSKDGLTIISGGDDCAKVFVPGEKLSEQDQPMVVDA